MKLIAISQRLEKTKYGENRAQLDIKLFDFVTKSGLQPVPLPYFNGHKKIYLKMVENWLKKIKPKGLILSGGEDVGKNILRDNSEIFLINYFKKKKLPILGICRGMQLIAVQNGSKLKRIKNHVNKCITIFTGRKKTTVKCYHNYTIQKCPQEFEILSICKDKSIESIKSKKEKILGIMWHPEREKKFNSFNKKIFKNFFS
jgi:gamma-glutamyl-gamma-aminobutyrate hydrolase PuuD